MGFDLRRVFVCLCASVMAAQGQRGIVTTVAGLTAADGVVVRGYEGDGGAAKGAAIALANMQNECDPGRWEQTNHLAVDKLGNVYVADAQNQRIRRIGVDGRMETVVGSGQTPVLNARCEATGPVGDGEARGARLYGPAAVAVHEDGRLVIADQMNNRIRQVVNNVVSTVVGSGAHNLYAPGIPATASPMDWPSAVGIDGRGLVYFAEVHGNRVGRVEADGRLSTVAGTGFPGYSGDGGAANRAALNKPAGMVVDGSGNVYIADTGNHRVRKVSGGVITTVAGNGQGTYCGDGGRAVEACLQTPMGVAVDASGNVYIADTGNHRVRRVGTDGVITTVAGTGQAGRGADGVAATESALHFPNAVVVDGEGSLYLADWQNYLIRKVTFGGARPVVGTDGVRNAFSLLPVVAPGSLVTIVGSQLGEEAVAGVGEWPEELGGTRVRVNGEAMRLGAVSGERIRGVMPAGVGVGAARVEVVTAQGESEGVMIAVQTAAPGILAQGERAVAADVEGGWNSVENPVRRGGAVMLLVTGLNGVMARASVGAVSGEAETLGAMPGMVGVEVVRVRISLEVEAGAAVAVQLEAGRQLSNVVRVAVR